jgi:sortase (surface protein transpeptidase)
VAAGGRLAGASRTTVAVAPRLRIPDLGINRTIREFPCDRAAPPENYIYRWGCAGRNNLYLLGHADTVFKALHDAYAAGRLRVGMAAMFTDSKGRTVTYRVTTWRVVRPDQVDWAIASQPVPSMTLQTCYGAKSEYRLLVRLVAG